MDKVNPSGEERLEIREKTVAEEIEEISRFNVGVLVKQNKAIADSFGELQGREDLSQKDFFDAREGANKVFGGRGRGYGLKHYEYVKSRADFDPKWSAILDFLGHDVANMAGEVNLLWHLKDVDAFLTMRDDADWGKERVLPSEFQRLYQKVLADFPLLLEQILYPYKFTIALSEIESGRNPSEVEDVDLRSLIVATARNLQLRFRHDDYSMIEGGAAEPCDARRNTIELDLCDASVVSSPAMIWSIITNLSKNGAKELACPAGKESDLYKRLHDGVMPEKPKKILVKCQTLEEHGVTLVHVADSGEGLKVDEIVKGLKEILKSGLVSGSHVGRSIEKILAQWRNNPFAFRRLNMGNLYDFTGLLRLSGFAARVRTGDTSSSGLGLWGANYLVDRLGGVIIPTSTVDGGAMFTVILPNDYFGVDVQGRRRIKGITRKIRSGLERGKVNIKWPLAA